MEALSAVNKHLTSIDPKLRALVELRVSQINGCGYCVDMHSTQARLHGETQQRLDCLQVWRECDFFEQGEIAAFRWAEALTDISHTHAPDEVYDALTPPLFRSADCRSDVHHFDDERLESDRDQSPPAPGEATLLRMTETHPPKKPLPRQATVYAAGLPRHNEHRSDCHLSGAPLIPRW
jgi:AhpD family alkylhydroperoxidase